MSGQREREAAGISIACFPWKQTTSAGTGLGTLSSPLLPHHGIGARALRTNDETFSVMIRRLKAKE